MAKQAAKKPAAKAVEAQPEILETPVVEVKESKPKNLNGKLNIGIIF